MNDVEALFEELERQQQARRLPPVHQWQPENVGEIDIRIASNGQWLHEGEVIKRGEIVRLFATILRCDAGDFYLVTPVEKLRIRVDDAPFVAVDVIARGSGTAQELLFTTNLEDHIVADSEHPIWLMNGRPYLHVRDGLDALINRPTYYQLAELADLSGERACLISRGAEFDLGAL